MTKPNDAASAFLRGEKLIGDDYNPSEIERWFKEEKEGYADLGAKDRNSYTYVYHALNWKHAFSKLPDGPVEHALGLGSAYGDEFRPILSRIGEITILDPSDQLEVKEIDGVPVNYRKPDIQGTIRFPDASFDLVTCFGVLHHIPNVSYVIREMTRVLRHGGYALIREPSVSMGDWRYPRPGLTTHERGIPEHLMRKAIDAAGLDVVSLSYCDFAPISKIGKLLGVPAVYNSQLLTLIDAVASKAFSWNTRYQYENSLHKVAPSSIFWVCQKR